MAEWGYPVVPEIRAQFIARDRLTGTWDEFPVSSTEYSGFTPTVYAAPADVGTGDGSSEANAMDLPTALANATAGAIIGCIPGIYSAAVTGVRWVPLFTPGASGTVGSPIRVVAKYPAVYLTSPESNANRCELRTSGAVAGTATTSPVLGNTQNRSHNHFYGFYADETDAPARPSNGVFLAAQGGTGIQFHQCVVDMNPVDDSDNFNAIFAADCDDLVVRNCRFRLGNDDTSMNHNVSAITTYGARTFLITHCHFDRVNSGVFLKAGFDAADAVFNNGSITFCLFEEVREACINANAMTPTTGVSVSQCLSVECGIFLVLDDTTSPVGPKNLFAYNNTIVDVQNPLAGGFTHSMVRCDLEWGDGEFYNNICAFTVNPGTGFLMNFGGADDTGSYTTGPISPLDRNCYYVPSGTMRLRQGGVTSTTLANWQASTGKETNSINQNPLFVGASDFRLQGGSPCLGTGTGGLNMGCYLTGSEEIGVESE